MPIHRKVYTNLLTDKDRIKVRQVTSGHDVIDFSVQYEALIESRWRKIARYDSAHGQPHRHVYRPNDKEYKHPMNEQDNNLAFTEAQTVIKRNFMALKERYIIALGNAEGDKV